MVTLATRYANSICGAKMKKVCKMGGVNREVFLQNAASTSKIVQLGALRGFY